MTHVPGATATLRTAIPARLDRLPWSRFHWRIVIGLGTVWILDGLEITIVGAVASRMIEPGSGITVTAADIGTAAALYVAGACIGALFFGQLTDRMGRKKLFMVTLAIYLIATVLTAFAFAPWYFFLCRFFTGVGIGGEYSAINSAIDELIPARNRGQVDLTINGSFWVGSGLGALLSLLLLDASLFAPSIGWRIAFGLGFVIGLGILLVRRHVPESPRWLLLRGRVDEAERIVSGIEQEVRAETGAELPPPPYEITVRLRQNIRYRDLVAIALFYAVGTAAGGIAGPLLFGNFIHSGNLQLIALGFFIGAAAMAIGGLAELVLGVRAEGRSLEAIATPLTAEEADADPQEQGAVQAAREPARTTEEQQRAARERNMRIMTRAAERDAHDRHGLRSLRPGPGSAFYSPAQIGTAGTTSRWAAASDEALDREIAAIEASLDGMGPTRRGALAGYVGGRAWGPGRFNRALRQAVDEGRVQQLSRDSYGPGRGRGGRRAVADR
jgi:MFS family permease